MSCWIALFLAVAANIGANAALKHFVTTTEFAPTWESVAAALGKPSLWIGLTLAATLLVSYLYAIRGLPLGIAYTLATTLSIAGITCASVVFFGEALAPRAALGIGVIMLGVVLLATS